MPNGLLGKKVVNARDTEVVYTVPAARTSTFNLNVLNNGESAATVNVYVSDKVYQTRDFEDYLTPLNYNKTWVAADTSNTLDLVGQSTSKMMTAMKTTPVEPAAANTASSPIAGKKIETLQTANGDGNFFLVSSPAAVGNPLPFYTAGALYVRSAPDGGVYTFDNFFSGGAATTASTSYGQTATDNVLWATNENANFAMSYVQGVPGGAGSVVNSIADYRVTAATYNTAFTWGLGAISKIAGIKTSEERFIIGTTTGFNYMSNDATPQTQSEFQSNTMSPPTGISGFMIGAAAIEGSTVNEGNIFIAYSGNKVAYAGYTAAAPFPVTGYSVFDFPSGVVFTDVVDIRAEGTGFVIVVAGGTKHSTADLGITWTASKHYAAMPVGITVASISGQNKFVNDDLSTNVTELTFVRGRTYRLHQQAAANNGHPLQFSEVSGGPHSNGTPYSTGMKFMLGDPTATAPFTVETTVNADWVSGHVTHDGKTRIIEWTVPASAPNTLYTYCPNHTNMGYAVSIVDEDTVAPHDDATALATVNIYNADNGDADRRYDLTFNGEAYMREKRFYALPLLDKYEKSEIAAGEILERTAIMASVGEQVIVTTSGDSIVVRVHGIEE
jgi:hypothetical protein|tara:strand:+ start:1761 stop:3599 length:1839 start_codon:yes stop_codon:yes gene_type:complete